MMKILRLSHIKEILKSIDVTACIEESFILYSKGQVISPPIGEMVFKNPPGDVHIKYGYIVDDDYYVIKIASGFYHNTNINLSSSNGLLLVFSQKTGEIISILLDEGYLTNLRTAAAGAVAAKYLAPKKINRIGIIGTGTQARLQLSLLKTITDQKSVLVFGRNTTKLNVFESDMKLDGFRIKTTQSIEDITSTCNLIVTTTPTTSPILLAKHIKQGTHITAVGADSPYKQELDENIFGIADNIVADSIEQCVQRGEISHAMKKKIICKDQIKELGNVILSKSKIRTNDNQITIADLTGLAIQDIQIAKQVGKMNVANT